MRNLSTFPCLNIKSVLALALVPALVVPLIQWDVDANTPERTPEAPPAVVGVATAVTAELAPTHWAPGSVISRQDARVASEQGGRVIRVAEVGQQVQPGQALAVLDDTALRLREQEAQADLARIQAQLELATRQEQRYAQLAAQQNIARAQYEQLRADRDMLVQDRARAQALLAQTRHQRTQMTVRAPFAGVVAERQVQLGEYLTTGDAVARYREEQYDGEFLIGIEAYTPYKLRVPKDLTEAGASRSVTYTESIYDDRGVLQSTREKIEDWTVEAVEEIEVPAGSFEAYRLLRTSRTSEAEKRFWFVDGVGKVKEVGLGQIEELVERAEE